jgi:hypothetical protein
MLLVILLLLLLLLLLLFTATATTTYTTATTTKAATATDAVSTLVEVLETRFANELSTFLPSDGLHEAISNVTDRQNV